MALIPRRNGKATNTNLVRAITARNPIATNSVTQPGFDAATVGDDARQTYIVVHRRFPALVRDFLAHKRKHGSEVEKNFYWTPSSWSWEQQVARLGEFLFL